MLNRSCDHYTVRNRMVLVLLLYNSDTSRLNDSEDLRASDLDSLKKTKKPPHDSNHGEEVMCHCEYIITGARM